MARATVPPMPTPITIDRGRGVPSYVQLADHLRARIRGGAVPPGGRMPPERELISASGLSRVTVRQGLGLLEREGWVVRRQGLGTFVRQHIDQELSSVRTITEVLLEQGITPEIKVLSFGAVRPAADVRRALRLGEAERLLLVKRLYQYQQQPIALIFIYLPLSVEQEARILRSATTPTDTTYTIWEERLGVQLRGAQHVIRAAGASREDARALRIRPGAPILILERLTYGEDGRPLEYIVFHYHAERYEFSAMLPRGRRGATRGLNGRYIQTQVRAPAAPGGREDGEVTP